MCVKYFAAAFLVHLIFVFTTVSGSLVAINNVEINSKKFYSDISESAIMTWTDAMDYCQRVKMEPARIDSLEENNLVFEFLNNTFVSNKWFWLGATDYGSETYHYWLPSGDQMIYENWTSPSQTQYRVAYNCVRLDALTGGKWFSEYCNIPEDVWKPRPLCQIDSSKRLRRGRGRK